MEQDRSGQSSIAAWLLGTVDHRRTTLRNVFSPDLVFDRCSTIWHGELALTQLPVDLVGVKLLESVVSSPRESVLFESADAVTGLQYRYNWTVVNGERGVNRLVEVRTEVCDERDRETWRPPHPAQATYPQERFGFGPPTDAERDEYPAERIQDLVLKAFGGGGHSIEESGILVNKDLVFVPVPSIGTRGILVERETDTVYALGSGLSPRWMDLWAYYRGIPLGRTSGDRLCTLSITKVTRKHKLGEALERALSPADRKALFNAIEQQSPPYRLRDFDAHWVCYELFVGEVQGWFSFEIETDS